VQHVLQTTTFMTSQEHVWTIDDVKREIFGADPPANAAIGVAELPYGATVEIQAIAGVTSQP
jgi:enamine deaminase RidA (YjgF/YER057c/UK114 family)